MSVSGQRTGYTASPRNIFYARGGEVYLPGQIMDGTNAYDGKNTSQTDEIRAGMILAQITSTKKWVPCRRTTIAAGGSGSGSGAGSLVIPVVDSRAFKAGEVITIEGTNLGTISRTIAAGGVDYDNDLITVGGAAFQYNTGAAVYADPGGSLAGAQIPRGILAETVRTLSPQPFDSTTRDTPCVVLAAGFMDVAMLLGDYAACRDTTTNYLGQFLWSDRQAG